MQIKNYEAPTNELRYSKDGKLQQKWIVQRGEVIRETKKQFSNSILTVTQRFSKHSRRELDDDDTWDLFDKNSIDHPMRFPMLQYSVNIEYQWRDIPVNSE